MSRKEFFYVSIAQKVVISTKEDISGDDWFENNYSLISDRVSEVGYSMEELVDMYVEDEHTLNLIFLVGQHTLVCNKDFRGYTLSKGDFISFSDKSVEELNKADIYGSKKFSGYDTFEISCVCHNENNGCIDYYIKCFVEGVTPLSMTL